MKKIFTPFNNISPRSYYFIILIQVVVVVLAWQLSANALIPRPSVVLQTLMAQLTSSQLWDNLLISLVLTLKAMFYSIIITLVISYLSVIRFFQGLAKFIVKCRYLTLTGLIFIFTLLTTDGEQLKLSLLIFGIVPFFVTSFLQVIVSIDRQEYDLCKTLGYNNWETLYEVIIVGKADYVFDIIRQNFAIAWLMITLVEGLSMGGGGIGTLLIKYNKYNDLTNVVTLQVVLFGVGLIFDYLLLVMKYWLFPYSKLKAKAE
jgi:sulfonate transport system permease protein